MKNGKKHVLHTVLCLFLLGLLFAAFGVQASAAGTKTLKVGRKYQSFDITGDKKKDTVQFKTRKKYADAYSGLSIYVNGKLAYSLDSLWVYRFELKLIRLKNGKPFLYVYGSGDNDDGPCVVLQYKGGRLKKVIDLQTLMRGYGTHETGSVKSISGNKVTFEVHLMSYELGAGLVCDFPYQYNGGTLKRMTAKAKIDSIIAGRTYMTAAKKIQVYKKPGTSKKAFTIKKGQTVSFPQVWLKKGKLWVQVKVQGKTGWIPAAKTAYDIYFNKGKKPNFAEIAYAG